MFNIWTILIARTNVESVFTTRPSCVVVVVVVVIALDLYIRVDPLTPRERPAIIEVRVESFGF